MNHTNAHGLIERFHATRRGWFRRAGLATAAVAVMGALSLNAHAHGGGGPGFRGGFFGGAQSEERVERMLGHLFVELKATDEQKAKISPIVRQAIKDLAPLREQMRATRGQAASLLSAERVDRNAIENLRSERMKNADVVSKRMSQAMADVAEVLTPEQRRQLAQRMQKRQGRGMGHHG